MTLSLTLLSELEVAVTVVTSCPVASAGMVTITLMVVEAPIARVAVLGVTSTVQLYAETAVRVKVSVRLPLLVRVCW